MDNSNNIISDIIKAVGIKLKIKDEFVQIFPHKREFNSTINAEYVDSLGKYTLGIYFELNTFSFIIFKLYDDFLIDNEHGYEKTIAFDTIYFDEYIDLVVKNNVIEAYSDKIIKCVSTDF